MPLVQRQEPFPHWQFEDPASGDQLRLVPERGGLVCGWRCNGQELLYFDAERFADPGKSVRGGIPVLFPICGNLPDDTLELPQGRFKLPQHGFARDLPWSLTGLPNDGGVRLELSDSAASRSCFPFAFRLQLDLQLQSGALAITARIANTGAAGTAPLPFSLGLHPYFAVTQPEAVQLEGLPATSLNHLTMAPAATADQLERLGEGVDLLCHGQGPVRLVDAAAGRAIRLETNAPLDLVVVWTEPPRPMVCLEPWTAPRGALASGERRLELQPGEQLELNCCYRLESS
jgi:galactose mutarotase-like enzyme